MKNKKALYKAALKHFQIAEAAERQQRAEAVEDMLFAQAEDGQWTDKATKSRKGRPRFTINRVAGAVAQIVGDQRQQRTNIKIQPLKDGASEDLAKTFEGLIRNIEHQSKAFNAYCGAFDETVNGGFGGWRVETAYEEDSFDQSIFIRPIKDAATRLWFDPAAVEYDKRDAQWAFLTIDMPLSERKEKYPNAPVVDFSKEEYKNKQCQLWGDTETMQVAEYWYKEPVMRDIALMSDGKIINIDEDGEALNELEAKGITIVKQRKAKGHKVMRVLMDGAGILEEAKEWAGKYIPLIPVYGYQHEVAGKTYTRGLVRFAKDANRIYNYTTSATVEAAALSPKDPYWITAKQAEGYELDLANFNLSNKPFLFYNADPQAPGAPQRGGAPSVQTALIQQTQQASMDLYHVTGMQPPSLGVNPELKSGKAIRAQEALGDRGNYIFSDNLAKSQQYTGEILMDLIPRIMDSKRQENILMQDGETEIVELNKTVYDQESGKEIIVNDLSIGKYAVTAESGPAFATQRQESAQQIIDLMTKSPAFEGLAMDLVAKDLPIIESKELAKRVRKQMIMLGTIEPTKEEVEEYGLGQEQAPDPQQQAITENIQLQSEEIISKIEKNDAEALKTTLETQNLTLKGYRDLVETLKDKIESGIPLNADDIALMIKQQDIMEEAQQQIDEGPNSQQRADIIQNQPLPQQPQENTEREALSRVLTVNSPSSAELAQ